MVKKTLPCKRNSTLDVLGNTESVEPKEVSDGEVKNVENDNEIDVKVANETMLKSDTNVKKFKDESHLVLRKRNISLIKKSFEKKNDEQKLSPRKIHKVVSKKISVKSKSPKISPKLHRNNTPTRMSNIQKENSSIKKRNGKVKNLINAFEKTIEMSGADPKIMTENLKIQGNGPPQDAFQLLMGKRGDTPLKTSQKKVKRRKKTENGTPVKRLDGWLRKEK